jgi:hypothetical protein
MDMFGDGSEPALLAVKQICGHIADLLAYMFAQFDVPRHLEAWRNDLIPYSMDLLLDLLFAVGVIRCVVLAP